MVCIIRQAEPLRLIFVVLQLALLAYVARMFRLEHDAFHNVLALAIVGFVIHHVLPMALRLPFFVLLSLGSLVLVVGTVNAVRLTAVGLILIGLCHLPIRFNWRLALIAVAAAALVMGRADKWIQIPSYDAVWPILGSMFMFRLIIYLYDLKNRSAPFGTWQSLAYFFMLPNVCFPMYPVVDYQAFNRNYYDESPWKIYQIGVKWIFRGIIHLLLYRLISQNLLIEAALVTNAADLVRYMISTYLLYLQISGQFHIIVGMLHLFGFNLPETHHLYFLSSSFTDFWRRINIYWKDFILKIFFNPVYFRCKKLGPAMAMTIATFIAFFFTWLLHSYQWFWIRGAFFVTWQDIVFWSILALLVLVNALYEQRYGRNRKLKGTRWSLGARITIGLQTIATFSVIVTLWCLWNFQGTFADWLTFMSNIGRSDLKTTLMIIGGLLGIGATSAVFASVGREYSAGQKSRSRLVGSQDQFPFWQSVAVTLGILLVGALAFQFRYFLPLGLKPMLSELRSTELGLQDRDQRDRGYYEDLTNTKNYNVALWELYNFKPKEGRFKLGETPAGHHVPDKFHQLELVPLIQIEFRGATFTTNRWAMRDRDYELQKPPGVFRIAILGASTDMGAGVADDETYENLVEDRLNREFAGRTYARFEVLNFSIGGYRDFQKLWLFDRAVEFQPDVVIWVSSPSDNVWAVRHLANVIKADVPIPYPDLRQRLEDEGLNARSNGFEISAKLWQMMPELQVWMWNKVKQESIQRGATAQVILFPRLDRIREDRAYYGLLMQYAQQVGLPVLDLTKAYDSVKDRKSLQIAPWDDHPKAEGHRLLAETLYQQMMASPFWQTVLGVNQTAQDASPDPTSNNPTESQ